MTVDSSLEEKLILFLMILQTSFSMISLPTLSLSASFMSPPLVHHMQPFPKLYSQLDYLLYLSLASSSILKTPKMTSQTVLLD